MVKRVSLVPQTSHRPESAEHRIPSKSSEKFWWISGRSNKWVNSCSAGMWHYPSCDYTVCVCGLYMYLDMQGSYIERLTSIFQPKYFGLPTKLSTHVGDNTFTSLPIPLVLKELPWTKHLCPMLYFLSISKAVRMSKHAVPFCFLKDRVTMQAIRLIRHTYYTCHLSNLTGALFLMYDIYPHQDWQYRVQIPF